MLIVKDRRGEWKIRVLREGLELREFPLTLRRTGAVKSGDSVGKLKRNEQSLFRDESPGFIDLPFRQHVAKLAWTPRSIQPER